MNEFKYELDKYMGDTTELSSQLKKSIKMQKKSKKRTPLPWIASIAALFIIGVLSYTFFSGGGEKPIVAPPSEENPVSEQPQEQSYMEQLKSMFHEDGQFSYFVGDAGEYSSHTQVTYWLDDNHVQLIKDNTGSVMLELYRITDNEIQLLLSTMYDDGFTYNRLSSYKDFSNVFVSQGELPFDPTAELSLTLGEALNQLQPIETHFSLPLEVGSTVNQYTVVDILDELTIKYGTFKNVYVLENEEDDFVYTRYFANPGGFIKWSHQMISDEFEITGELQTIHGDWASSDAPLEIKNYDNTATKQISLNDYPFVKSYLLASPTTEATLENMYYVDIPSTLSTQQSFVIKIPNGESSYLSFLIFKNENGIKEIPLGYEIGSKELDQDFSPNGQYFIYRLELPFAAEENNLNYLITKLVVIDLLNQTIVYPTNASNIFDINSVPITKINWTSDKTFTVDVADIGENSYYELEQWYKNPDKPTNSIEFTLE